MSEKIVTCDPKPLSEKLLMTRPKLPAGGGRIGPQQRSLNDI
ncbi:hypothetical protein [Bradyrhizobium elkanii]|nr:hypothetical protein [Bradyrhizobium elkanii]WLA84849.1 hypothetical protein QNJ99_11705 [Bradyrhizobium elkanii]